MAAPSSYVQSSAEQWRDGVIAETRHEIAELNSTKELLTAELEQGREWSTFAAHTAEERQLWQGTAELVTLQGDELTSRYRQEPAARATAKSLTSRTIDPFAAKDEFTAALQNAGLRLQGDPIMDGKLRRLPVEGDRPGKKSGSYVGHLDNWPAGYIRNYKTGEETTWKATAPTVQLTPEALSKAREEAAKRHEEQERERQRQQASVAAYVERVWNRAQPAPEDHPYLQRKQIGSHELRVDAGGHLLVPMRDADSKLWSLQRIAPSGEKYFTKGGRAEGTHFLLGELEPGRPLVVAEGFATAATLHEATGLTVAVAYNSGNLAAVARAYREHDSGRPIVIAGDNDHQLPLREKPLPNVGREKAEAAAQAVDGIAIIPGFSRDDPGTDWNDYAQRYGLEAVRMALLEPWKGTDRSSDPEPSICTEEVQSMSEDGQSKPVQGQPDQTLVTRQFQTTKTFQPGELVILQETRFENESDSYYAFPARVTERDEHGLLTLQVAQQSIHDRPDAPASYGRPYSDDDRDIGIRKVQDSQLLQHKAAFDQLQALPLEDHRNGQAPPPVSDAELVNEVLHEACTIVNNFPGGSNANQRLLSEYWKNALSGVPEPTAEDRIQALTAAIEQVRMDRKEMSGVHNRSAELTGNNPEKPLDQRESAPLPSTSKLTREHVEQAIANRSSLRNQDLSGIDLSGLTFRGMDLSGANLSQTKNDGTTYEQSVAVGANFSNAEFRNTRINDTNAAGSQWDRSRIDGLSASGVSSLAGASFSGAAVNGLRFDNVQAPRISFRASSVENSVIERSALQDADFSTATLRNATIWQSDLADSKWVHAHIENPSFLDNDFAHAQMEGVALHTGQTREREQTGAALESTATPGVAKSGTEKRSSSFAGHDQGRTGPGQASGKEQTEGVTGAAPGTTGIPMGLPSPAVQPLRFRDRVASWLQQVRGSGTELGVTIGNFINEVRDKIRGSLPESAQSATGVNPPGFVRDVHETPAQATTLQDLRQPKQQPELAEAPVRESSTTHETGRDHALQQAILQGNNFRYADLRGAQFKGIALIDNNFQNADLRGIRVDQNGLERNRFEAATLDPGLRQSLAGKPQQPNAKTARFENSKLRAEVEPNGIVEVRDKRNNVEARVIVGDPAQNEQPDVVREKVEEAKEQIEQEQRDKRLQKREKRDESATLNQEEKEARERRASADDIRFSGIEAEAKGLQLLGSEYKAYANQHADPENGIYFGQITGETDHHVIQKISPRLNVIHEKGVLDQVPAVGASVQINYAGGAGKIQQQPTQNRERDFSLKMAR